APARPLRRCHPQRMQEPVRTHVQEQAELVGLPARARGLVRARAELHVLDQVLHAPARAVDLLVEMLAPACEVGDDEARVGAELGRLDAGDHLLLARPGLRRVLNLMEAAYPANARLPAPAALLAPGLGQRIDRLVP